MKQFIAAAFCAVTALAGANAAVAVDPFETTVNLYDRTDISAAAVWSEVSSQTIGGQEYTLEVAAGVFNSALTNPIFSLSGGLYGWSSGIGIYRPNQGDYNHQVDGHGAAGSQEAVLMRVLVDGALASGTFNKFKFSYVGRGDGATVYTGSDLASGFDIFGGLAQLPNGWVSARNLIAPIIAVAAPQGDDDWKLKNVIFSPVLTDGVSEVPLPGALPLMAAGLAGFGFARRKAKA